MALVRAVVREVSAAQAREAMKKLRIIIETDISTWAPDQIEAYRIMLQHLLRDDAGIPVVNKKTWIVEESEDEQ